MKRNVTSLTILGLFIFMSLSLMGCGGGGGSTNTPPASQTVSGVAATGSPISGTVYLKDSSNPVKEISTTINTDGSFSLDVSGLTAPFILKAVGTGQSYTLYSFAGTSGRANINPLSNLAVVQANNGIAPTALYAAPTTTQMQAIKTTLATVIPQIQAFLQPVLSQYNAESTDFISAPYSANHMGLDLMFDLVAVNTYNDTLTMTNKVSGAVILTSPLNSSTLGGQIVATNIPSISTQRAGLVYIYPTSSSVATSGTVAFNAVVMGTANQAVTWSVAEAGGGYFDSAGVYTAPDNSGLYHVKATSMADTSKNTTAIVTVTSSNSLHHSATLLYNGKVLIAGGSGEMERSVSNATLYDPSTGNFTATGKMTTKRQRHTATLLPNGKVLITGGENGISGSLNSAELYDPSTGIFTATGSMTTARRNHTATLLSNGKVLITGGINLQSSAELYDPSTGVFTDTGSMATTREKHTATLLSNGKVLIAGGYNGFMVKLSSAELYDPSTGIFTSTGGMSTARYEYTATPLPNGKVLVAGGMSAGVLNSAELYDPSTGIFTSTGSMTTSRWSHTATLLPNGKVLFTGGGALSSAELYDPSTGIFTATGSMTTTRVYHTATLLPNGKVLIAGGISVGVLNSADLYDSLSGVFTATESM